MAKENISLLTIILIFDIGSKGYKFMNFKIQFIRINLILFISKLFFLFFSWEIYRAVIMQLKGPWMRSKTMLTQKIYWSNWNIIFHYCNISVIIIFYCDIFNNFMKWKWQTWYTIVMYVFFTSCSIKLNHFLSLYCYLSVPNTP